ncbi:MAG: MarR family transcriptional regulator [Actinomycetota bacterium]|nr:MarR family transcriptional regulator [Actinomycetota bacterium]MDD5667512.1 MarR family transcriptional regulator [Actinomycetota bacterium]
MKDAKKSPARGDDEVFVEMVETVFLFMHEQYGEFGAILKENDINYTQYVALITVYMNGALSEGDLAKMMFINPSTVSRMVYALEKKGWVKSARDKADRRRVIVTLSPSGRRKMEEMRDEQAEVVAHQVARLGEEERKFVYQVAEFVNKALRLMISAGAGESGEADS